MSITIDIISLWNLIQFLDLFGTMAFAVTGAIKAVERRLDISGVIFLATITGLEGYKRCSTMKNSSFWDFRTLFRKHCSCYSSGRFLSIS